MVWFNRSSDATATADERLPDNGLKFMSPSLYCWLDKICCSLAPFLRLLLFSSTKMAIIFALMPTSLVSFKMKLVVAAVANLLALTMLSSFSLAFCFHLKLLCSDLCEFEDLKLTGQTQ